GKALETNYPAARLLREAESLTQTLAAGKQHYGPDRSGQFWLTLPAAGGPVPVRVQVPEGLRKDRPVPLVVALHGAGGSDTLFFDAAGGGAIARLCAARGWLLAAPRNGLPAGLLDEVRRLYPVDRQKVFLVGHSMGAAQAVAAACDTPSQFRAVAALGGGGRVVASEGLKGVAFFVAAGTEDFALAGARTLQGTLKNAGVRPLQYRDPADVEHLVIVRLALPGVFAFFDGLLKA